MGGKICDFRPKSAVNFGSGTKQTHMYSYHGSRAGSRSLTDRLIRVLDLERRDTWIHFPGGSPSLVPFDLERPYLAWSQAAAEERLF